MASFSLWCFFAAITIDNHADSFHLNSISHHVLHFGYGNKLNSNVYLQRSLMNPLRSIPRSLVDISDEVLTIVKGINSTASLISRPGFTFGLGCDEWEASSYSGSIEGWNSEPMIRWVSRSLLKEVPYESKAMEAVSASEYKPKPSSTDIVRAVQTRLDLHFTVGSAIDIPNMRISISETEHGYSILLDYVPRLELISSLEYFDKYFQNVEGSLASLVAPGILSGIAIHRPPDSVLSKMLRSPFATSLSVKLENGDFVRDLCLDYVNRWCSWLNVAVALQPIEMKDEVLQSQAAEVSDESRKEIEKNTAKLRELKQELLLRMYERDQRIQKLFFEEQKYELAGVMGSSFAPKAAELAAAIIGPSIGTSSYSLY